MSSPVIPTLRYEDAPKAIDWLVEAFGFVRQLVVEGEGGRIDHAQLTFGTGMVMLGSVRPDDDNDLVTTASESGKPTSGIYVVVEDVDAHAARVRDAGADIVLPPEDKGYGGRGYTCRDLKGNVWSFGDYDPWSDA